MKVTERGIALLFILRMPAQSDQGEAEAWSWNSSWTFPSGGGTAHSLPGTPAGIQPASRVTGTHTTVC